MEGHPQRLTVHSLPYYHPYTESRNHPRQEGENASRHSHLLSHNKESPPSARPYLISCSCYSKIKNICTTVFLRKYSTMFILVLYHYIPSFQLHIEYWSTLYCAGVYWAKAHT